MTRPPSGFLRIKSFVIEFFQLQQLNLIENPLDNDIEAMILIFVSSLCYGDIPRLLDASFSCRLSFHRLKFVYGEKAILVLSFL